MHTVVINTMKANIYMQLLLTASCMPLLGFQENAHNGYWSAAKSYFKTEISNNDS